MAQPVLLAVDSDRDILTTIERDLTRRFAADYRIVTADTPRVHSLSSMLMIKWQW
jgi:hypothetical protein